MLGNRLGMSFLNFVAPAVISLIAAFIVHYVVRCRVLEGFDGFLWKWVVSWAGTWLGSPVLGDWFHRVAFGHIFIAPAFLGALIGAFVASFIWKAEARTLRNSRMTG